MTHYVPTKLTTAERDLLDWLVSAGMYASRSDCIRHALQMAAQRHALQPAELRRVVDEREQHPPRVTSRQRNQRQQREGSRPKYRKAK